MQSFAIMVYTRGACKNEKNVCFILNKSQKQLTASSPAVRWLRTLYQTDLRITSHRRRRFSLSLTLLGMLGRVGHGSRDIRPINCRLWQSNGGHIFRRELRIGCRFLTDFCAHHMNQTQIFFASILVNGNHTMLKMFVNHPRLTWIFFSSFAG